jgi:Tol biopolymer transport system component
VSVLGLSVAAPRAGAQYFGQNKVRYHDFDFQVLETPHFDIYYYSSEQEGARLAGVLAERWYAKLSAALGHELRRRQPLVLYASHSDFVETNVVPETLGDGIGGVTEGQRNRIVLPFGLSLADTDHVIGHELVHAFQYDLARHGHPSVVMMPLWFIEGMAEFYSVAPPANQTAMWMRDAVQSNKLPTVKQLADPRYFPYRYGHALWLFIAERHGPGAVARLLEAKPASLAGKVKDVLGLTLPQLTTEWHRALRTQYGGSAAADSTGTATLVPLVGRATGGRMNIAPALSPDGRRLAFVSEKDLLSVEVFLADVATGQMRRKLLARAANPHFDSLEFIDSAGAWDPTGRRLVLAAVRKGHPVLVIIEPDTGATEREIPFPTLGQICNPTWSPDGSQLAFTGSHGGWSDLYTYSLVTGELRRLMHDAFADLHPAWSPDGRTIALATDRFSTRLAALNAGECRLALFDLATGEIRPLAGTRGGRNIDPHWSSDGRSLFFLGDPDGTSNVYKLNLATHDVAKVTAVATGVTGITPMSPALSVAGSTLAMSVYRRGEYEIVKTVLPAERDAGSAGGVEEPPAATPLARAAGNAVRDLKGPGTAARHEGAPPPPDASFLVRPYRRKLTLEGVGDPYVSAGGGPLGSFLQAGMSVAFGDMLGDQQLGLAIRGGRRAEDFAGRAMYINRRSRWNRGVSVDYLPAVFATSAARLTPTRDGIQQDVEYEKQFHTAVTGIAMYPFNRSRRFEVSGGIRHIGFAREIDQQVLSIATGKRSARSRQALPGEPAVNLVETGAALVYDTAVFGATSPILGRRYRFEVAPTFGTLNFATFLADYRQYFVPARPFTLALRARYVARVGHDASDPRLLPLVLTLRGDARGYDLRNVAAASCGSRGSLDCSILDLLTGSSLLATNAEIRFPLPGVFTRSYSYGPVPMEGFVFADAASLRTKAFEAGRGWRGHLLRSVGAGLRVNAAGIIFELAAARPYDRPQGGWALSFNIGPGF